MYRSRLISLFFYLLSISFFITSCKKDIEESNALDSNNYSLPSLSTDSVTAISFGTAISGGRLTGDGGTSIIAKGVCWSTSTQPTIENSYTFDGTGSGDFKSSIKGLTLGTTYYVRAYAVNSVGTSYGNQVSFTTSTVLTIGSDYLGGIIFFIDTTG